MMEDTQQKLDNTMAELDRVLGELEKSRRALHSIASMPKAWCANWRTCPHRDCQYPRRVALMAIAALPDAGVWRVDPIPVGILNTSENYERVS